MTEVDTEAERAALTEVDRGDRKAALSILIRAYGPAVHRFCRAALKDEARADDAYQTTFVDGFESLSRFQRRSTLLTWLLGIASHRCLDEHRRWRRWMDRFTGGEALHVEDPIRPTDQMLEAQRRASFSLECLDRLRPEDRIAVLLRCQEGLSYEVIARMTRAKVSTLQMRVSRSLPVLRGCIETKESARNASPSPPGPVATFLENKRATR